MARLKSSANVARRTDFIGVCVTPNERAEVERRAALAGMRKSDFVRVALLSRRPSATTPPRLSNEAARKLAFELARVGTNLNQLAHHANATGTMPARDALEATLQAIVKATEALTRL